MIPALTAELKEAIKAHALETPEAECIGLIVRADDGQLQAIRSSNTSANSADEAIVTDLDFALASEQGEVIGIYHSHINGNADFSKEDIQVSRQEKLWMVLYHLPTNHWQTYHPDEKFPLIGREWHTHYRNCFWLFKDFCAEVHGITIEDYYFDERRIRVESAGYVEDLPKYGFTRMPENTTPQKGDIILIYNGCRHPNHCICVTDAQWGIHHNVDAVSGLIRIDGLPDRHSLWRRL